MTYGQVVIGDLWRNLVGTPDRLVDHWRGHHRLLSDRDNPAPRGLRPLMLLASPSQEQGLPLTSLLVELYQSPRLGPLVAILFLIGLTSSALVPARRSALVPGLTVLALHAASAATVGAVGRYHHPPEPLMHVVAARSALFLLQVITRSTRPPKRYGGGCCPSPAPPAVRQDAR